MMTQLRHPRSEVRNRTGSAARRINETIFRRMEENQSNLREKQACGNGGT